MAKSKKEAKASFDESTVPVAVTAPQGMTNAPNQYARFKRVLLEEKQRIINQSKKALQEEIAVNKDDLPDETDLAVSEINQSLVFKLRDRDRVMLTKIDQALARMDEGSFGICQDCEEPIEPRRLEVRPISTLCVACQETEEHKEKVYA